MTELEHPMGFNNPDVPWPELERRLVRAGAGQARQGHRRWGTGVPDAPHVVDPLAVDGDGGDSPAWSRKRPRVRATAAGAAARPDTVDPYAELHCHTNFSFLDGASHPEELAEEAARLGLTALAVTDHDGFYGVVRFSEAARELGLPTIFGAELSLGLPGPQNGEPDPLGPAPARCWPAGPRATPGWPRAIAAGPARGRGEGPADLRPGGGRRRSCADHVLVLTGCRKGTVPRGAAHRGRRRGRARSWTGWSRCSARTTSRSS